MKTVRKYEIDLLANGQAVNVFHIPKGASILGVHLQYGKPVLYALVDPNETSHESRTVVCVGTGYAEVPIGAVFLGTLLLANDSLVIHFFEKVSA